MNIQSLARKVEAALRKIEAMSLKDNYFVFWKGEEQKDIPDRSLVVILTKYEEKEPKEAETS